MADGIEPSACPKCGRDAAPAESACPRCGLLRARWNGFLPSGPSIERPELDAPWERALTAWLDESAHERVLKAAIDCDGLPSLARRYRARRVAVPDDPMAARRERQILALVETQARLQAGHPLSPRTARGLWVFGYAVAALVLCASLWFLVRVFGRR